MGITKDRVLPSTTVSTRENNRSEHPSRRAPMPVCGGAPQCFCVGPNRGRAKCYDASVGTESQTNCHAQPVAPHFYQTRAEQHRLVHDQLAKRSLRVSNLRGLSFVVFAGGGALTLFGAAGLLGLATSVLGLATFIWLVVYHARVINRQELEQRWMQVNLDAAARVRSDAWHDLPNRGEAFRDTDHSYAEDLDLVGRGSLFQRLCTAQTRLGQTRLFEMLAAPAAPDEIAERQKTVRVLARQLEFRQHLEVLARGTQSRSRADPLAEPSNLEPFLTWAEAGQHSSARWPVLAWVLPCTTGLAVLLAMLRVLPGWPVAVLLVLHLTTILQARPHVRELLSALTRADGVVERSGPLFELLEANAELGWLQERLTSSNTRASVALNRLSRIGGWFELRHNGLVYPFVNLFVLWDVHCWLAFRRWQQKHGTQVRAWFGAFADVEALSSLACFAFDEPAASYAELVDDGPGFEAVGLGHPLIAAEQRVTNDVRALAPGFGLLVTGSNMSGKSTYLRAIGLAAVLGLAGGPVCAQRLRVRRVQLVTSMRISDSIASGVSHFYAELLKLKRVLSAAQGDEPVLFLLDEILHGTNSRERQIGARYILAELLRYGALGAVSTHDSGLCTLGGELATRLTQVHFRESVVNNQMTFDYRVYPGPVSEGNALRLMQRVGIPVPLDTEPASER